MDTSDPEIVFDDRGICNHCRLAERRLQRDWHPDKRGRAMLETLATAIRGYGRDKEYDSIIGISGGVDSSYLLHMARRVMGLRPLAVHVDAGWDAEIAAKNIESLITALDVDLFTYVVDWEEIKDLQLAFLKSSVANQDIPQDHAFVAKTYQLAIEKDIRYVLTGNNLTSESILPDSWGYDLTDRRHLRAIHRQFGRRPLKTFPTMSYFDYYFYWPVVKGMKRVAPLNLIDYDKAKAIEELAATYGWRYYGRKHGESNWTAFFQAYYLPYKFGYDKRRAHLSSLIIAGQKTRADALEELKEPPFDAREVDHDKAYVARKLGIDKAELERLIDLPNRSYSDYPNNARVMGMLRGARRRLAPLVRAGANVRDPV
jgi:aminotransferase